MNQMLVSTVRKKGQPAWEIAHLFPLQGTWDEEDYFALDTNHLVELSNGCIEVLPMPTMSHQLILAAFYRMLLAFVEPRKLGTVVIAGLPVRLWKGTIREPDVVFMFAKHADRMGERCWQGADLAMEVVSGGQRDRQRDLKIKRAEYAQAGIREYWIVDPKEQRITVSRLFGRKYVVDGEYGPGERAKSALLRGFEVDVSAVLAAK